MGTRRDRQVTLRILFNIALFASVLWAPWWVAIVPMMALLAMCDAPEVFAAGVLMDGLYGTHAGGFAIMEVVFTVGTAIAVIVAWYGKRYFFLYAEPAR